MTRSLPNTLLIKNPFFRAFGHEGAIEAGAIFEFRVAKKPGSSQLELIQGNGATARAKGGKKFADLFGLIAS